MGLRKWVKERHKFRMKQVKYLRRHPKEMLRNKWKQDGLLILAAKDKGFCQHFFGSY